MANNDMDLKLKIEVDNQAAELNLKKTTATVQNLGSTTEDVNKKGLSDWIISVNKATEATKNLAITTKEFISNEIGIGEAKESIKSFLVNATAGFLKLREAFSQESSFSAASRTIAGTDEQLKKLNKDINDLASTDLAVTTEELNNVASVAGAMGKSVESIPAFVRTVSEGVVGLAIPAEDLAEKLGTLQTQLNLTEEGLTSLSDQVNSVADTLPGKVKEIDIFEVLSMGVATAGKQFGLLKGETIALTGTLLSLGEAPETARTGLINLLSALQNAKNQTPDFQAGLEAMGTSADKLAADIKAKPLPTLTALLEQMHGLSNAARLDIATKFLGKGQDAIALTKLVDNTNLLKQALETATDATKYSGSVHDAYAKQVETADAKVTILWNSIKIFSAGLVTTFLPVVKLVIDGFTGLVNAANKFSQNHPIIRTFIEVAGTVLSLGGALRLLGLAMSAVGLLSPAITMRIAALGASFLFLSSSVTTSVTALWTFIRTGSALSVVRFALVSLFGGTLGLAVGAIALFATGIAALLPKTVQWGETTATVSEIIAAAWRVVMETFDPLLKLFSDATTVIGDFITQAVGAADFGDALSKIGRETALFVTDLVSGFKFLTETIVQSWASIAVEMEAGATLLDDIFSGKGILDSIQLFTAKTGDNMAQFSATVKENVDKTFGGTTDTLDKFNQKIDESLKKSRAEKPLDKADTKAADGGSELALSVDPKDTKAALLEKEKLLDEAEAREMMAIINNEAEKIRIYSNTAVTKKQIDDFTFQQKLISQQQITTLINVALAETLAATEMDASAKRTALVNIESATTQQIKNLTALEQEHRNKAIAFVKEIEATELQRLTNNRALDDMTLTSEELAENKKRQLATDTAKIKDLIKNGEFAKAAELGKKTQELAFDAAKTAREIDIKANQSSYAAQKAREDYNKVVSLTTVALNGASKAEIAQAEIAKTEADKRKLTLDQVRAKIVEIEEATKNGVALKVSADTKAVDDAIARIKQPTSSVHTIHNQIVNDAPAHASGGLIRGKGTGTSDEVPAMLSNGEYVIKADVVAKHGVAAFDAINYGNVKPQNYYASGGYVGDDKLKQKADELKQAAYAQAVAVFDDPKTQIVWRMDMGQTSTGSADVNSQQKNFENRIGEYLKKNNLPLEWRDMYIKGVKAKDVLRTSTASFMEKAQAQLSLDSQFSTPQAITPPPPETPRITRMAAPSIAAPSFPSLTPANFSPPSLSVPATSGSRQTGQMTTVKFVAPDGNSAIAHSSDPNLSKLFDTLTTVGGVTRTS